VQDTLDALRQAMKHTGIMCAVMLDTKVRRARGCKLRLSRQRRERGLPCELG